MKSAEEIHDGLINENHPANRELVLSAMEQYAKQSKIVFILIGYDYSETPEVAGVFYNENTAKDMKFVCESEYRYSQIEIEQHEVILNRV